jgi:hypothetical protein
MAAQSGSTDAMSALTTKVRSFGMSLNVEGFLRNSRFPRDYVGVFRDKGRELGAAEARAMLRLESHRGRKVVPCSSECGNPCPRADRGCKGFDYTGGGCPGYEKVKAMNDPKTTISCGCPCHDGFEPNCNCCPRMGEVRLTVAEAAQTIGTSAEFDRMPDPPVSRSGESAEITSLSVQIACALARMDGYDATDRECGLYDLRWSGGPNPEPEGDAWSMEYLPKGERIAEVIAGHAQHHRDDYAPHQAKPIALLASHVRIAGGYISRTGTYCVDFDDDPAHQLSLLVDTKGCISYARYDCGELSSGTCDCDGETLPPTIVKLIAERFGANPESIRSSAVPTVTDAQLDAILARTVCEGEDVGFYLQSSCEVPGDPECTRIMMREVIRTIIAAVPEPPQGETYTGAENSGFANSENSVSENPVAYQVRTYSQSAKNWTIWEAATPELAEEVKATGHYYGRRAEVRCLYEHPVRDSGADHGIDTDNRNARR